MLKKVIKAGDGTAKPAEGMNVKCHYVGRLLDGNKFDSSRDRDSSFDFKLGSGVIQGWSDGVATMEPGETAHFAIKSDKVLSSAACCQQLQATRPPAHLCLLSSLQPACLQPPAR
eukprot:SAG22_NODE_101_length_20519_cov_15.588002_23_plen_115_part_00